MALTMNNETSEPGLNPPRSINGNFTVLTEDDLRWFNEGTRAPR